MRTPLILCLLLGFHSNISLANPLTVVELFTSQGCHSCPRADKMLGALKQRPNTIALACHVTYWNYLGWKDTFSLPFCDQRQHNYQAYLQGRAGVYTPQMIINGRYATIGINKNKVQRILAQTQSHTALSPINITQAPNKQLSIQLPTIGQKEKQQVFLFGTEGDQQVAISRGENGGKKLQYHNPINKAVSLGEWSGKSQTLSYSVEGHEAIKEWVVITQQQPSGRITAAGKLTIN